MEPALAGEPDTVHRFRGGPVKRRKPIRQRQAEHQARAGQQQAEAARLAIKMGRGLSSLELAARQAVRVMILKQRREAGRL